MLKKQLAGPLNTLFRSRKETPDCGHPTHERVVTVAKPEHTETHTFRMGANPDLMPPTRSAEDTICPTLRFDLTDGGVVRTEFIGLPISTNREGSGVRLILGNLVINNLPLKFNLELCTRYTDAQHSSFRFRIANTDLNGLYVGSGQIQSTTGFAPLLVTIQSGQKPISVTVTSLSCPRLHPVEQQPPLPVNLTEIFSTHPELEQTVSALPTPQQEDLSHMLAAPTLRRGLPIQGLTVGWTDQPQVNQMFSQQAYCIPRHMRRPLEEALGQATALISQLTGGNCTTVPTNDSPDISIYFAPPHPTATGMTSLGGRSIVIFFSPERLGDPSIQNEFQNILVHELSHAAVGLPHSHSQPDSLMYPYYRPGVDLLPPGDRVSAPERLAYNISGLNPAQATYVIHGETDRVVFTEPWVFVDPTADQAERAVCIAPPTQAITSASPTETTPAPTSSAIKSLSGRLADRAPTKLVFAGVGPFVQGALEGAVDHPGYAMRLITQLSSLVIGLTLAVLYLEPNAAITVGILGAMSLASRLPQIEGYLDDRILGRLIRHPALHVIGGLAVDIAGAEDSTDRMAAGLMFVVGMIEAFAMRPLGRLTTQYIRAAARNYQTQHASIEPEQTPEEVNIDHLPTNPTHTTPPILPPVRPQGRRQAWNESPA